MLLKCTEDAAAAYVPRLAFPILQPFFRRLFHDDSSWRNASASFPSSPWSSRRSPPHAQSGNAGTVHGTVTDPIRRRHSQCNRPSCQHGQRIRPHHDHRCHRPVQFPNVPFNPYTIDVSAKGFAPLEPECRDSLLGGNQPSIWFCKLPAPAKPSPSNPGAT